WRQLPFTRPDQLVFVWENTGANGGMAAARVTGYRFTEWQRESRTLASAALFGAVGFAADRSGATEIVNGVRVSTNYFDTLGIAPLVGRGFVPADGEPGA